MKTIIEIFKLSILILVMSTMMIKQNDSIARDKRIVISKELENLTLPKRWVTGENSNPIIYSAYKIQKTNGILENAINVTKMSSKNKNVKELKNKILKNNKKFNYGPYKVIKNTIKNCKQCYRLRLVTKNKTSKEQIWVFGSKDTMSIQIERPQLIDRNFKSKILKIINKAVHW
jgi:hypothetical protein